MHAVYTRPSGDKSNKLRRRRPVHDDAARGRGPRRLASRQSASLARVHVAPRTHARTRPRVPTPRPGSAVVRVGSTRRVAGGVSEFFFLEKIKKLSFSRSIFLIRFAFSNLLDRTAVGAPRSPASGDATPAGRGLGWDVSRRHDHRGRRAARAGVTCPHRRRAGLAYSSRHGAPPGVGGVGRGMAIGGDDDSSRSVLPPCGAASPLPVAVA